MYNFSERHIRKHVFRFLLGFSTISLEDLLQSIYSIYYWISVAFLSKIYQKIYLPFPIGIVYHFSGRFMRKYIFRFLLGFCTILLEDLSKSKSSVSYSDFVPVLWKIYQKVYFSFFIANLCHFSGRSLRKYIFRSLLGLCTISLEDLSENISSVPYWDCAPFLWKIYQQGYIPFFIGIVYHFPRRSIRHYNFPFLLGLCTISLEDLSKNKSSVFFWDSLSVL